MYREKTIEEWFTELPEPTRTAALAARSKTLARGSTQSKIKTALYLSDAILYGFEWKVDGDDEEEMVWSVIYDDLTYKKPRPIPVDSAKPNNDLAELIKLGDVMHDRLNKTRIIVVNGTEAYDDGAIMKDSEAQEKWKEATEKYRKS
jgi:hypothetical protein